jgi:hypothetical protein
MITSILTSTKKVLGISEEYTAFDEDIIMHINTVFSTLNQIGLGPAEGFQISDATAVWSDFLAGDIRLNNVKSYMFMRVKLMFDPPSTSYLITSMQNQVNQLEWRLSIEREGTAWVDPNPPVLTENIYDGGEP